MSGLFGFGCDIPGLVMMRRYTTGPTVARRRLGSGMHFFGCWMYIVACWLTSISVLNLSLRSDLFAMFRVLQLWRMMHQIVSPCVSRHANHFTVAFLRLCDSSTRSLEQKQTLHETPRQPEIVLVAATATLNQAPSKPPITITTLHPHPHPPRLQWWWRVDPNEVVIAVAVTVPDITSRLNLTLRQEVLECVEQHEVSERRTTTTSADSSSGSFGSESIGTAALVLVLWLVVYLGLPPSCRS